MAIVGNSWQELSHLEAGLVVEDGGGEEVVEGAALVVVGDEQHLGPAARALDVRSDEAEDVVMPHQHLGSRSVVIVTL